MKHKSTHCNCWRCFRFITGLRKCRISVWFDFKFNELFSYKVTNASTYKLNNYVLNLLNFLVSLLPLKTE